MTDIDLNCVPNNSMSKRILETRLNGESSSDTLESQYQIETKKELTSPLHKFLYKHQINAIKTKKIFKMFNKYVVWNWQNKDIYY